MPEARLQSQTFVRSDLRNSVTADRPHTSPSIRFNKAFVMLEIILVYGLCKSLGNMLRAKGRKPLWMQVMLVVTWVGGEVVGGFVAGVVHVIRNGPDAPMGFEVYLIAIFGAVLGAGFTFFVAYMLPSEHSGSPQETLGMKDDSLERRLDPNNPYAS